MGRTEGAIQDGLEIHLPNFFVSNPVYHLSNRPIIG